MERLDEGARQQAIADSVERIGRARVADLAREFAVSTVTIRKDLNALERRGVLRRVHGAATRLRASDGSAFPSRVSLSPQEKRDIARRAAQRVPDGAVIALDSSSTVYFLAKELLQRRGLTVVTYSLPTASLLLDGSTATVHLLGGVLSRSTRAVMPPADLGAPSVEIEMFFGGAHSASPELGLGEPDEAEAATKRHLALLAPQRYALLTSDKADETAAHTYLGPDEVTGIFTDPGLPADVVSRWRAAGVRVDAGRTR